MKTELIQKVEELLGQSDASAVAQQLRALQKEYQKTWTAEFEKNKQMFIDEGGKAKEFEYTKTDEDLKIEKLFEQLEKKKKEEDARVAAEQHKNLEIKKEIIAKINDLSEVSTNIGTAIKKLLELQSQWKETGAVSTHKYKDIQADYSKAIESFNYKLNIAKQLQEHDLKRNFELKTELLEKLKLLKESENTKETERLIKVYRNDWEDIGPVPNDKWDALKQEFRQVLDEVYKKVKSHYKSAEEEKENNLQLKKELIEKTKSLLNATENADYSVWNQLTNNIIEIQNNWKDIGRATQKENDLVWFEFRALCDSFFEKKKSFFAVLHEQQAEIKKKKEVLIQKAESLQNSSDWQKTSQELIKLQNDWKKQPHINEREDNKLFFRFRKACNTFFEAKKNHFDTISESYENNVVKKEEILSQLNSFNLSDNTSENLTKLKQFATDWNAAGFVPFKDKKRLNEAFYNKLDELYEKTNISKSEKLMFQFKTKIERFAAQDNAQELLKRESDFLRKQVDEITGNIKTYENNMGFFKNAKSDNPLFKEVNEKIEIEKQKLNDFSTKRKLVNDTLNKLREPAKKEPVE